MKTTEFIKYTMAGAILVLVAVITWRMVPQRSSLPDTSQTRAPAVEPGAAVTATEKPSPEFTK